ncbi:glycosyltransferase family 4 protein [Domibacillus mangrovi]|uniref:Glycosyl transferase family 1 domain-containing protein n=1 Tax=Domibacillus mangrovi TaxID=1714354 RepID=A0A1Q5P611_9BACI|nr:glycosyltransferase [Domibacillus mangrovi]OKL37667.1 hypothetical protein BLL40_05040 [Domibacillus mangrovi]
MKIAWAHDHYFLRNSKNNQFYSEVEFPYEHWTRYLSAFEQLSVMSRHKYINTDNTGNLNLSSGDNVDFIEIPNLNNPLKKITSLREARKRIRQTLLKSSGLIARLPSEIGLLAIEEAIKLKKPWAVELVGCPWDALTNLNNWKAKAYAPFLTKKVAKAVKNSTHVLYVTENFLQNRYPTNGKSIHCSNVNIAMPKDDVLKNRLQKEKGETTIVGLIGYLSFYKGIDTAIKAISELSKNEKKVELHILGGGLNETWINFAMKNGLSEDQIKIKRVPSGEPVLNWLDTLDIYIQPSRTEGLPRGLIEAMSRGCPAIASSVGGIPELLTNEFIHAPNDFKELAVKIEKIISNKELSKKLSIENFEKSKLYSRGILDEKRKSFWGEYADYIKGNGSI